jgi:hypothetical protein
MVVVVVNEVAGKCVRPSPTPLHTR